MNYRIEGNELIVKNIFSEKRYNFRELTKLSFVNELCIFQGDKCILKEKDIVKKCKYAMQFYHMAVKNDLIIEDQEWFDDEISMEEIPKYCNEAQEWIKETYYDYVKQELGSEYELEVSADISPYHAIIFVNILCNGEKVCAEGESELYWSDGEADMPLIYTELVMPTYVDAKKQQFRMTKLVDIDADMKDIKYLVGKMKEKGCVTARSLIEKG